MRRLRKYVQRFAAVEIVEEGIVRLSGLLGVLLGEVDKIRAMRQYVTRGKNEQDALSLIWRWVTASYSDASILCSSHNALNRSRSSPCNFGASHFLWDLRNMAKAFALATC